MVEISALHLPNIFRTFFVSIDWFYRQQASFRLLICCQKQLRKLTFGHTMLLLIEIVFLASTSHPQFVKTTIVKSVHGRSAILQCPFDKSKNFAVSFNKKNHLFPIQIGQF